ncbi:MAG: hypothetical protein K2X27_00360 [Candidatus Obscuribacterales bacterium]|nr:hypothetical protein [Candidatus Obscuribacterales bacterium]
MAGSFSYTAPGGDQLSKFSGEIAVDKLGRLRLNRGIAVFNGDQLEIKAVPEWIFDRTVLLRGPVLRAEVIPQNGKYLLAGLAFILDGPYVNELSAADKVEVIVTLDGKRLSGRVISRTPDSLQLKLKNGKLESLPFTNIKTIESARALTFNISADSVKIDGNNNSINFEARSLQLRPVSQKAGLLASRAYTPASSLPGTEPGISRAAIATFLAIDLINEIAPAIAIPLVVNSRNQKAAKEAISKVLNQQLTQGSQVLGSSAASAGLGP